MKCLFRAVVMVKIMPKPQDGLNKVLRTPVAKLVLCLRYQLRYVA